MKFFYVISFLYFPSLLISFSVFIQLTTSAIACTCSNQTLEQNMCRANFAGLVYVKGTGPSSKYRDSYVVEWRQSFQMSIQAMRAFSSDFGTGIVWTTRKHTSCALKLITNTLYLMFGRLGPHGEPMVSFCTAIPYKFLDYNQRLQLNIIAVRGLNCNSIPIKV